MCGGSNMVTWITRVGLQHTFDLPEVLRNLGTNHSFNSIFVPLGEVIRRLGELVKGTRVTLLPLHICIKGPRPTFDSPYPPLPKTNASVNNLPTAEFGSWTRLSNHHEPALCYMRWKHILMSQNGIEIWELYQPCNAFRRIRIRVY